MPTVVGVHANVATPAWSVLERTVVALVGDVTERLKAVPASAASTSSPALPVGLGESTSPDRSSFCPTVVICGVEDGNPKALDW